MLDDESIAHQQELLETYRRNLGHLLRQAAKYGGESAIPVHIFNDIREARMNIFRVKEILRANGVIVEDLPDDEEPNLNRPHTATQNPRRSVNEESVLGHRLTNTQSSSRVDRVHDLFIRLLGFILPVLGGAFLQYTYPAWSSDRAILVAEIVLTLFVGLAWLFVQSLQIKRTRTIAALLIMVFTVGIFVVYVYVFSLKRGTVYFIIDRSINMENVQGLDAAIRPMVAAVRKDIDIGMTVAGGGVSGKKGCGDFAQYVPPTTPGVSIPMVDQVVRNLVEYAPNGPGTLQPAILNVITEELTNRRAVQQIIVITSGIDERCGQLDRKTLEEIAYQSNVKFSLCVIAVGAQQEEAEQKLKNFATNECYINLPNASQIPSIVPTVVAPPYGAYGAPYRESTSTVRP